VQEPAGGAATGAADWVNIRATAALAAAGYSAAEIEAMIASGAAAAG
jgi:hypothetical protein